MQARSTQQIASQNASKENPMSPEESRTRIDLAGCCRLIAHFGWADATGNHVTARVPGEDAILVNPYDLLFEDVTASSLIKLDLEGNLASPTNHELNPTAFAVHSGFYVGPRQDIGCAIHVHSPAGMAVSCLSEGILPLNQNSMLICENIAYHDYEGIVLDLGERERMIEHLGDKKLMILRNHGTMTFGESVGEAFMWCSILETVAKVQMSVLAAGRPISPVAPEAVRSATELGARMGPRMGARGWAAHQRILDRVGGDYRN
jgi:ribulose-5-phosphate 4-epimerase/fuculose-1-phosphate aldolase